MPDPISLSDREMSAVMAATAALPPSARSIFLSDLAVAASVTAAPDIVPLIAKLLRSHQARAADVAGNGSDNVRHRGEPIEASEPGP